MELRKREDVTVRIGAGWRDFGTTKPEDHGRNETHSEPEQILGPACPSDQEEDHPPSAPSASPFPFRHPRAGDRQTNAYNLQPKTIPKSYPSRRLQRPYPIK